MVISEMEIRLRADIARLQRDMDSARRVVSDATGSMERAANAAKGALASIAAGLGIQQFVQMADQYAKFTAQLKLATSSQREYAGAYADVKRIATSAQQDLASTGMLYARIANGTRELGTTQKEVAAITETVNMALKVSGATANESASAQLQLSQAFAAGALRGEEFNAVNEAAPRLMQALGDGIGVPVGALKKMAEEGKITSSIMADVLPKALEKVREEAKQIQTIGGSLTVLKDSVMELVGVQANASGVVSVMTSSIEGLAKNLGYVAAAVGAVAAIYGGRLVGAITDSTVAKVRSIATSMELARANEAAAATELRRAQAEQQAALIGQSRAREKTMQVQAEVAADRQVAASAAAAAEQQIVARQAQFAETANIIRAEIQLEQSRHAAQINGIGRAQRVSEMARLATQLAAAERGMAAESTRLAATRIANEQAAAVAAQASTMKIIAAREAETVATGAAAASTMRMRAASAAVTATTAAASVAGVAWRGALAALGGPLGLVITALSLGAIAWQMWGKKADESTKQVKATMADRTKEIIADLEKQIAKINERNRLLGLPGKDAKDLAQANGPAAEQMRAITAEIARIEKSSILTTNEKIRRTNELGRQYSALAGTVKQLNDSEEKNKSLSSAQRADEWRGKNGTAADRLKAELENTKKELGGILPADIEKLITAKYADKGAIQSIKQEASAYTNLTTSIHEKITANEQEMAAGKDLSESQKMQIAFDTQLKEGKLKLAPAHKATTQALLDELAASEKKLKLDQAQREVTKYVDESVRARGEMTAALKVEYAMYGKSADARARAMVAVDAETWKEKELAKLRDEKKPVTDEIIKQLDEEAKARTEVGQATMMQTKALGYASQLAEENKRFGLDYIADDKARAAATLELDAEIWRERIALAGEGTEAQRKLQANFDQWYRNQSAKPYLDEQKRVWQSIESTAHDTFISIFDSGKSVFQRLTDTLKNGLLELLYQMTIKKWVINIGASMGFTGAAGMAQAGDLLNGGTGAGGGIGGQMSLVSSAMSAYKAVSTGFAGLSDAVAGGVQSAMSSVGYTPLASQGLATASGQALTPMASMAGTAAGYLGGAAVGIYGGRAISGGYSAIGSGSGNTAVNVGTAIGAVVGGPIGAAIGGAIGGLVNRAFGMKEKEVTSSGIRGTLSDDGTSGQNYSNWKQKGGWFRSDKSGTDISALPADIVKEFTAGFDTLKLASSSFAGAIGVSADSLSSYSKKFDIALGNDQAANEKAIADFFVTVGDEMARRLVPAIDQFTKSGETASGALQRLANDFKATDAMAQMLGKSAVAVFGSAGLSSASARERLIELAGGVDVLTQQTSYFSQNFLTEAERLKPVSEALATAMGGLGLASVTTREQFKQVIDGLNLTTEAGAKQYVAMMGLAEAFAAVHPAIQDATAGLASYRTAVTDAYNAEASSLRNLRNSAVLGNLSPLSPQEKYSEAKAQYEAVLAAARGGDEAAQSNYQGAFTTFLEASRAVFASSDQFKRDFDYAQAATEEAARWAEAQVDVGQAQLDAIKASVVGIIDVKKEVMSLREALLQYSAAQSEQALPVAAPAPTPIPFYPSEGRTNNAALEALQYEMAGLRHDLRQSTGEQTVALATATSDSAEVIAKAVSQPWKFADDETRVAPQ
jgi:tape measure domain-containing protein